MIDLYYWPTPNGLKITILLQEIGLEYQLNPINIGKGDQFDPNLYLIHQTIVYLQLSTMGPNVAVNPS